MLGICCSKTCCLSSTMVTATRTFTGIVNINMLQCFDATGWETESASSLLRNPVYWCEWIID